MSGSAASFDQHTKHLISNTSPSLTAYDLIVLLLMILPSCVIVVCCFIFVIARLSPVFTTNVVQHFFLLVLCNLYSYTLPFCFLSLYCVYLYDNVDSIILMSVVMFWHFVTVTERHLSMSSCVYTVVVHVIMFLCARL